MNFTKDRFNNNQKILKKKKIAFDYNTTIHNRVFKYCKTLNKVSNHRNKQGHVVDMINGLKYRKMDI